MKSLWTYDIETININEELYPFAVGLYNGLTFYNFYLGKDLNYKKLINDSLDFLFLIEDIDIYIYIHNMDRFDSVFLIKYVDSLIYKTEIFAHNQHIYKIKITSIKPRLKKLTQSLNFIDSFKILQMKLSIAGDAFNVKHKKKEINFDYFNSIDIFKLNIKKDIILYLKYDCICLYEVLEIFFKEIFENYNIQFYKFLTISSLGLQIWEFYNNKKFIIENNSLNNGWKDDFIRNAYFGGRCEIYKPYIQNGFYYDLNSFYPFIMQNYEYPIDEGTFIYCTNDFILENFFGFLYCDIISPSDLYYPILPYRLENKLIYYPLGSWKGTYFIAELLLAKKYGYIIKPIHGLQYFKKGKIFESCIKDLYKKRINASLNIAPIYKLIMNSLSGRFGMHSYNIKQTIMNESELDKLFKMNSNKVINATFISEDKYYVELQKTLKFQKQSSVQISAAITSYARVYLYELFIKLKNLNINMFYTDTDSIVTDKKIPDDWCGIDLGKFKLVSLIMNGFFLNQKIYYIFSKKSLIKKFKGINSNLLKDLTIKELFIFLEDKENIFKFDNVLRINRNLKYFSITKNNINISFYLKYDKRLKIFNNGYWIDTKPINLKT